LDGADAPAERKLSTPQATAPPDEEALAIGRDYFALFTEIGIIQHLSINRLLRALPDDLTPAQFGVLNHFVRLGGAWGPARLARAFQVTKGAMTNTLQRLEAAGLVTIRPDPHDARGKLVEITLKGVETQARAVRIATSLLPDVAGVMSIEEVRAILPVLIRVRKVLDENR
jgi:DNA-binding MarR family transcriptional regulator